MNKNQGESSQIIWPTIKLSEPNEIIDVYNGEVELRSDNEKYIVDAVVKFNWFPRPRPVLTGSINVNEPILQIKNHKFMAYIDNLKLGEFYVMDTHYDSTHPNTIQIIGFLHGDIFTGDSTISVEYIDFSVPNLRYIPRGHVKPEPESRHETGAPGGTIFKTDEYEITINAVPKCEELVKKLKNVGGYDISYGGRIKKQKGSISYTETKLVLEAFGVFLSFINGSQVNTLFHKGVYEGETKWQGYKDAHVKSYSGNPSWGPAYCHTDLTPLWVEFYALWKKGNDDREALRMSINWYLEAKRGSGYIEGGIMMAQTSLELLYNWLLIDTKKLLIGADAANISAANKIRLLLAQMRVSSQVPSDLTETVEFVRVNNEISDAPDTIVQIRNAIVHAQLEKRKKLNSIPNQVKYEALIISLWYVELAILYMLKYNGYYTSRVAPMDINDKMVPWSREAL